TAKFDLSLYLEEADGRLQGRWEFNTDLFDAATIVRWNTHWQTLLKNSVADPDRHVSDLSLMTAAEQHQVLVEWNRTDAGFPIDKCLHHVFEEQAARTPENVAVVYGQTHWPFHVLNERANQLAYHLIDLGVVPEIIVGICVERSPEMLVAMLATLK